MVLSDKKGTHFKNSPYWGGCGAFITLISYPKDCEMIQPWWKPVGQLLKKLNIHVPVIPPLGISQREKITPVHTKTST